MLNVNGTTTGDRIGLGGNYPNHDRIKENTLGNFQICFKLEILAIPSDMSFDRKIRNQMATFALQMCDVLDSLPRATAPTGKLQECVLLIEDCEDAMFLVQYALQEYGNGRYRLEWAKDLHDGLDQITKGGVDIVLLDLGLPESSGPATYASVREVAPDLPVLVLTGDTREETEFEITASGVEDYLVKEQVSGSLLLQSIRSALYATKLRHQSKIVEHTLKERAHWSTRR